MIAHLDNATDLYYSVSAPAMRGYISSRDFLDLRKIKLDSSADVYTGYFVSVESNLCPNNGNPKIVRGHNFPSMIRTLKDEAGVTYFEWLMKTDLKGMKTKTLSIFLFIIFFRWPSTPSCSLGNGQLLQ